MYDPYKKVAAWYDRLFEKFNKGLWEIGLSFYPPQQDMRVLDIGCGTGAHLRLYQKAGCNVFGIDMSPSMLQQARTRLGSSGCLCLASGARPPLANRSFDLILFSFVLHEMPAATRFEVLQAGKQLLKANGRLILIDYQAGPIRGIKGWIIKIFVICVEMAAGMNHFFNYRNFVSNNGLAEILSRHDLSVEKMKIVSGGNLAVVAVRP